MERSPMIKAMIITRIKNNVDALVSQQRIKTDDDVSHYDALDAQGSNANNHDERPKTPSGNCYRVTDTAVNVRSHTRCTQIKTSSIYIKI